MARLIALVAVACGLVGCSASSEYEPKNGDVVFQTSTSPQSMAIQLATHSPYSHMGIVYIRDGAPFVLEAVQPVRPTPLAAWIERGEGHRFVAKRLQAADSMLSADHLRRMREVGGDLMGRDYDLYFEWSDERIYCSELVWKVFDRGAGIGLGELQTIGDFDLSSPEVKAKLRERFGNHIPLEEAAVSPASIFSDPKLETVYEN